MKSLEEKIRQLPQDLQKEVINFIDFLLSKQKSKPRKKFSFEWIGG